jgi:predicted nucleic acid-binding protein
MKSIAIDASVVLKWYLEDEAGGQEALSLLNDFVANDINLIAPALLEYEVVSGLIIAQRRGRIPQASLVQAVTAFQELGITLKGITGLGSRIISYARAYSRSAYDAAYLAVAEHEKADFMTADKALYNTVHKDLSWVRLL